MRSLSVILLLIAAPALVGCTGGPDPEAPVSVDGAVRFFQAQGKTVLTFIGYSGSGYEDAARMMAEARKVLGAHDPRSTFVNIGATPDGIGAIYAIAKEMGFGTTGIVSTQAREAEVAISPDVDHVFFVEDATWGGFIEGTERLSPTSRAMVEVSDQIVGIGGGAVGRDEMLAARRLGKAVTFIAADMNHERAIHKAQRKGLPAPTDFRGAAHAALMGAGSNHSR